MLINAHNRESLYGLSNLLSHPIVDQVRIKWTELDAMTLPLHLFFNETMRKILESSGQPHVGQDILSTRTKEFLVWISHLSGEAENGTMKSFTLDDLSAKIDNHILSLGKEHHLMRGLVQLLTSMVILTAIMTIMEHTPPFQQTYKSCSTYLCFLFLFRLMRTDTKECGHERRTELLLLWK